MRQLISALVVLVALTVVAQGQRHDTYDSYVYPRGSFDDTLVYLHNETLPFLQDKIFPILPDLLTGLDFTPETEQQVKTLLLNSTSVIGQLYLDDATKHELKNIIDNINFSPDTVSLLSHITNSTYTLIHNANVFLELLNLTDSTKENLHRLLEDSIAVFDGLWRTRDNFFQTLNTVSQLLDSLALTRPQFAHLLDTASQLSDSVVQTRPQFTQLLEAVTHVFEDWHFNDETKAEMNHVLKATGSLIEQLTASIATSTASQETQEQLHALLWIVKVCLGLVSALIVLIIIIGSVWFYRYWKQPSSRADFYQQMS